MLDFFTFLCGSLFSHHREYLLGNGYVPLYILCFCVFLFSVPTCFFWLLAFAHWFLSFLFLLSCNHYRFHFVALFRTMEYHCWIKMRRFLTDLFTLTFFFPPACVSYISTLSMLFGEKEALGGGICHVCLLLILCRFKPLGIGLRLVGVLLLIRGGRGFFFSFTFTFLY